MWYSLKGVMHVVYHFFSVYVCVFVLIDLLHTQKKFSEA